MTKISQYTTDVNITGNDKWIGSDAQNFLITKNFTPNNLANYFNGNNVIDIGSSIRYRYQTLDPGEAREQGTISFETEIGPQVNFSDITTFLIAKNTLKGNTVTQYLDFLVDGKVLLSKASNINIFGYYKITSIEPWIPNTNFFVVQVDFLNGNGFIYEDLDYLVSLIDKVQDIPPPVWGSITGDIEDQTDLINYISSQITIPSLGEVLNVEGREVLTIDDNYTLEATDKTITILVDSESSVELLMTDDIFAVGDELEIYNKNSDGCTLTVDTGAVTSIFYKGIDNNGTNENIITIPLYSKCWLKCTDVNVYELVITEQNEVIIPTLASVLAESNITDGNDISISDGDAVILDNGSKLIKGTTDAGNGGNNGIALRCSIDYELKWEAGRLYVMEQDGFTIREVKYNFTDTPTVDDDNTKGFVVGSRWILDNDDVYSCTDDTTGAAVWELIESGVPTLQQATDAGNTTTNEIEFLSNTYPNSQIIIGANDPDGGYGIFKKNGVGGHETSINAFGVNTPSININSIISGQSASINADDLTDTRQFQLPDASGTIALTSDVPAPDLFKTTASGTDTYTATVSGVAAYDDGAAYLVRFTNGNTTGATLNINSIGAKDLYRNNDGLLLGGDIQDGAEMLCVYNSALNGFQCIGTSPNSLFAYVTNADSVTLTKGMPVYAFGGQGDRMTVKRANNSSDATSAQTVGLVLSNSIGTNQKGLIIIQGLLDGLSILPTSTFSDGDPIYLGSTDGSITNVKPYAPNHLVYLGVVTTASNGSAGRMYVRVQNGYEMQELHNVDALNPNNNDGLFYNSTSQLWEHKNVLSVAAERRNANNSSNNNINYCGIAPADSLESAAVWTITRLTISYAGAVTTATATSVEWDDRETATYT